MGDLNTSTRLGELLADKGVISYPQLYEAIQAQRGRRNISGNQRALCIGEILMELGYINRYQLHRALNSQSYVRKLTLVVALCAPLMTIGCGNPTPGNGKQHIGAPHQRNHVPTAQSEPVADPQELKGPVDLSWSLPTRREDGRGLDVSDLGGYELRYKLKEDPVYTYILISDPLITSYHFAWLEGKYQFQIAAYDKVGVYSDFVNLVQR